MSVTGRLLLACALLAGIQVAFNYADEAGIPSEVNIPTQDFRELPLEFGPWRGRDVPADPRLFRKANSYQYVCREYRKANGQGVSLYAAVFTNVQIPVAPHEPEVCYRAAGYQIQELRHIQVPADSRDAIRICWLAVERQRDSQGVCYWFQTPGVTYVNSYQQRKMFFAYRGQKKRPVVVKVMLTLGSAVPEQAEAVVRDLAPRLHAWIEEYLNSTPH